MKYKYYLRDTKSPRNLKKHTVKNTENYETYDIVEHVNWLCCKWMEKKFDF